MNDLVIKLVFGLAMIVVLMTLCAYAVLAERKVSSWIQGRVGPNRTTLPLIGSIPVLGRFLTRLGIFQPAADGAKFLFKEDVVPDHVNKFYFILAPILSLVPALTTVVVVPFGAYIDDAGEMVPLVLANLNELECRDAALAGDLVPRRLCHRACWLVGEFQVSVSWRRSRFGSNDFLRVGDGLVDPAGFHVGQSTRNGRHLESFPCGPSSGRALVRDVDAGVGAHFLGFGIRGNESPAFRYAGIGNRVGRWISHGVQQLQVRAFLRRRVCPHGGGVECDDLALPRGLASDSLFAARSVRAGEWLVGRFGVDRHLHGQDALFHVPLHLGSLDGAEVPL